MLASLLSFFPDPEAAANRGPGPDALWWLWLLVAVVAIAMVAWILAHLGPPGGRPPSVR
jgi:hypothetical protein